MLSTIELSTFALANNVVPELTHIIHRPYYDEESWFIEKIIVIAISGEFPMMRKHRALR